MPPSFKYAQQIGEVPSCPPRDYSLTELEAFRFVFDGFDQNRNFVPVHISKPSRANVNCPIKKCLGYACQKLVETARGAFQNAVGQFPWRGGFSSMHFYYVLKQMIPSKDALDIRSMHYALPAGLNCLYSGPRPLK